MIEKVHLKFLKLAAGPKSSTLYLVVYGELGRVPLIIYVQKKMIKYQYNAVKHTATLKLLNILRNVLVADHNTSSNRYPWLKYVQKLLNHCGLTEINCI